MLVTETYGEPRVFGNSPNPAAGFTEFNLYLPEKYAAEEVMVTVYDLTGRKVAEPFKGVTGSGNHSVKWECVTDDGSALTSGVYIYSVEAGDFRSVRKMVISR